ncbi:inositol polyphosphate multikinase isoform X3 [Cephus cinctus]|uniref:Kinase n=1 Tax=Cephus cinctus TaxID=211228 RepID=A0AAJ7RJJ7_CEPCN|nr:inositol polyphosphate multikinase isoform X3 [Cephus cinctus]
MILDQINITKSDFILSDIGVTVMATLPQLQPGERLRRRGKPSKLKLDLAAARIEHKYPDGIAPLDSQVGGHAFGDKKDTVGMLRAGDGCVLKPVEQPLLGEREIAFYERLQDSRDPLMAELRQYTPSYHGTIELEIFNRRVKFLKLKDITAGMTEPCVMDVKIGKRTWDPLAGPEKKAAEERKYVESKKAYGFCIPGFQIYRLSSSYVKKYGKDFGKKLNKESVVDGKSFTYISYGDFPQRYTRKSTLPRSSITISLTPLEDPELLSFSKTTTLLFKFRSTSIRRQEVATHYSHEDIIQ